MAQTIVAPAEIESPIDRPDGRSFFINSQVFYFEYSDLFASPEALIVQAEDSQFSHSVMVDISNPHSMFRWQLVSANGNGRTITELNVGSKGDVSGWTARYTSQGALAEVGVVDADNWQGAANTISRLITSDKVEKFAAIKRNEHTQNELAMANFILTSKRGDLTLYRKAHEKENARLTDRLKKFGFAALTLQTAPVK